MRECIAMCVVAWHMQIYFHQGAQLRALIVKFFIKKKNPWIFVYQRKKKEDMREAVARIPMRMAAWKSAS